MSYFNYPRLHFSGRFKASPSTINNTPNNYDPTVYPSPNELQNVELYWNPKGDGGFAFVDCVVAQVDYPDGTSSTTRDQDPIIGQPVVSVPSLPFPLSGALVDLDPMQQNVSEIWAMTIQIGGATSNLTGNFAAISYYAIWGQAQGLDAPHSSASGSGVYQSTLRNTQLNGGPGGSKFLQYFADHPTPNLSINFNVNTHNNAPPVYRFNGDTFATMGSAQPPVPASVLTKIKPMQNLVQNLQEDPDGEGAPSKGTPRSPRGDVPTKEFVKHMLQQYLTTDEFNANIDTILNVTALPYKGSTTQDFPYGLTTGTVGPAASEDPAFFVANRMMNPQPETISGLSSNPSWYAPFVLSDDGKTIHLNLGNSLPTELPGTSPWAAKLGRLWLVAFPDGVFRADKAIQLTEIPYKVNGFMTGQAGLVTATLPMDCSKIPLGILSVVPGPSRVILAEHPQGYYLRADQFVFRMNPGFATTPDYPRGNTATAQIHALQWGKPLPDGTDITVTMMSQDQATSYTPNTMGTGGTNGIKNLSMPREALRINGQVGTATARTTGGVARFDLSCTPPGNPRGYVNGQIYFLNYGFANPAISAGYIQAPDDLLSVLVYDQTAQPAAPDILAKFGRLYKIMGFLADPAKVAQIDLRNTIKLLLEKPFTEIHHMPVSRDMAEAERAKITAWINTLNNS